MLSNYKFRILRAFNRYRCAVRRRNHTVKPPSQNVGYLTIFHDLESDYCSLTTKDDSLKGISGILNIEKKYGVSATYNTVAKLIIEDPELIFRIMRNGHEIASHNYSHNVMTNLSKEQIIDDLRLTKDVFESVGLKLSGFRAPQSKWNFTLMQALLEQGISWNAEIDAANYPYIILQKKSRFLLRIPAIIDDWLYKSENIEPKKMLSILIKIADTIVNKRTYGSIGFHPWIHGEDSRRLDVFESFLKYVVRQEKIKILTFGQIYQLCSK
jgi:peptidoglycan/xylan/chitin deacetylase (PgdA/CDA1 family)